MCCHGNGPLHPQPELPHLNEPSLSPRSLSLQVDDEHPKSVSLPGGLSRLSLSSVFIGGIPPEKEPRLPVGLQALSQQFRGCIQHLVMGGA